MVGNHLDAPVNRPSWNLLHCLLPSFPISLSIAAHRTGRNPCATILSEGDSHLPSRRPGRSLLLFQKTLKREGKIPGCASLLPVTHRCGGFYTRCHSVVSILVVVGVSFTGIARVRFFARIVSVNPHARRHAEVLSHR